MRRTSSIRLLTAVLAVAALALAGADATRAVGRPTKAERARWLWQCEPILREEAKFECYLRLLWIDVESSRDPARELPRIDRLARRTGGFVAANCHVLMHEIGRRFGGARHLTLESLQRYVPRSNDPTCSAGFGMGLVMYLGPQILRYGARHAIKTCLRLPTRYRSYTCIHGLGHALMRAYHGDLRQSVAQCRTLGPRYAPDCSEGAFHDYWISLRGADGTTRPAGAASSPRFLCNGHLTYVRPCWHRYFIEQPLALAADSPADVVRPCKGLRRLQRSGCIAGSAATISSDPFEQTRICARLRGADAASCLRGVGVQALEGQPARQLALLASCRRMRRGARGACYDWYGRTLNVITNGRFERAGCRSLVRRAARAACVAGARRSGDALVTFS